MTVEIPRERLASTSGLPDWMCPPDPSTSVVRVYDRLLGDRNWGHNTNPGIGISHFWRDKFYNFGCLFCSDEAAAVLAAADLIGVGLLKQESV